MSVEIRISDIQPFKELKVQIDDKELKTIFCCALYDTDETEKVRKEYLELANNPELELALAQLRKHEADGDRTEQDFYDIRDTLQKKIDTASTLGEQDMLFFLKKHIIAIKKATIQVTIDGKEHKIAVENSQTAEPVESLWETPDECLAVLLDLYFKNPSLRDSLASKIPNTILNIKEAKVKN